MKHLALLIVLALARAAIADPQLDPAQKDAAAKLIAQGSALFEKKDFAGALTRYEDAFHRYPSPKIQFNRALALEALGRHVEAADAYDAFLAGATDAPADARNHAAAQLAALDGKLGKLAIEADAPGATASIDGADVGAPPILRRMKPGSYTVRVVASDRKPWEQPITVEAGKTATAAAALPTLDLKVKTAPEKPVAPTTPPPVPVDEHHSIVTRWWFWGAIGTVVIGGVVITYAATREPSPPESELGTFKPIL